MDFPIDTRETDLGVTFCVRIQPGAGRSSITGTLDGALKVALSAPPLEGRANDALVEFFSDIFRVQRSAVQIVSGLHARNKVIRIAGRTVAEVRLGLREHFTV